METETRSSFADQITIPATGRWGLHRPVTASQALAVAVRRQEAAGRQRKLSHFADRPFAVSWNHLANRVGLPLWISLETDVVHKHIGDFARNYHPLEGPPIFVKPLEAVDDNHRRVAS